MSRVRVHNFSISLDGLPPVKGSRSKLRLATPGIGSTSGCSPLGSRTKKSSENRAAPKASIT